MENEPHELTPQESIQLIKTMINKTRGEVADDSFYFLFWGWLVFFCCVTQFILKVSLQNPNHSYVWLLMPVGGIVSVIYGSKQSKKQKVKTYLDEAFEYVWIALAFAFVILILISAGSGLWQSAFSYYILLYAIGTFVSGCLLHFKPLIMGGLFNFILAALAIRFSFDYQLLITALAILISYIIPGHLLRLRYRKQKK